MSSPSRLRDSSPAGAPGRRRSRFTYRNLSQLAAYSATSPLRVIAHVDLDAFYAQCEMVRLGVPEDQPLAVQQWQGLIAVNYPARKFGINRMCTVQDAKKLCPELISQHVATWREGDEKWAYHPDAAENIATHKVSLDHYRQESRKILAAIKEFLPSDRQRIEKAGIDEVFLDLSAHVHAILLQRFPELDRLPPYDDPSEKLPSPSVTALDWQADALVDLDDAEAETDDPDWDDVAFLIGSEIVRDLRATIREKLKYTCSGGIANNKMISKLGSGHKKPNQQTVVRNRALQHFLAGFKFTKIRNLGGKLGDQVAQLYQTESVTDLLPVPLEQLKSKLGDDTGLWLYNTIRGIDSSEVNSRTQIKSMLSAKSFRPSINSFEQGVKWLRIFAADIFSRLVEEGVLEHKRRPRTMNLHHRHGGHTRSRQTPIPQGRGLTEVMLFELSKSLLSQIILEGNVWPCSNLSLSVGGFEEGVTGNLGIGAFLVRGDEAQVLKANPQGPPPDHETGQQPGKRRRVGDGGIQRFFSKKEDSYGDGSEPSPVSGGASTVAQNPGDDNAADEHTEEVPYSKTAEAMPKPDGDGTGRQQQQQQRRTFHDTPITDYYICSRCKAGLATPEAVQSHQDWHLAKDLQEEEEKGQGRVTPTFAGRPPTTATRPTHVKKMQQFPAPSRRAGGSGGGGGPTTKKEDPGQRKLNFG